MSKFDEVGETIMGMTDLQFKRYDKLRKREIKSLHKISIGKQTRKLRISNKMTMSFLAKRLDVTTSALVLLNT